MSIKNCALCKLPLPAEAVGWPHTEAACANELFRQNNKWREILALMNQVVAAHPCSNPACSCHEMREQIKKELT